LVFAAKDAVADWPAAVTVTVACTLPCFGVFGTRKVHTAEEPPPPPADTNA
jgi:hypothetical protein